MRDAKSLPIGVFDSGVGGLTVVRSIRKKLPAENIVYFGDTARVPYGNKAKCTVDRFSREIVDFLLGKQVKAIVIACNTASSYSLSFLSRDYDVPVFGVIKPGVRKAVSISKNRKIGVIGTEATVSSGSYEKELHKSASGGFRIFPVSCPLFVPLVENRMGSSEITFQIAEKYLRSLRKKGIDTLILGCTHYPMLKGVISRVMKGVTLVDSSETVAEEVGRALGKEKLSAGARRGKGRIICYVSDAPENFKKISRIFLKEEVMIKKAVLG